MDTKLKTTINCSPRKTRLIVNLIRNKPTQEALNILSFTEKKAAKNIKKLLFAGINNAINNFAMDIHKLYIKSISVDEGKKRKRLLPSYKGRVNFQIRRSSIVNLVLEEKELKPSKLSFLKKENKEKNLIETSKIKSESLDNNPPNQIKHKKTSSK